jgi:hypothetical protein
MTFADITAISATDSSSRQPTASEARISTSVKPCVRTPGRQAMGRKAFIIARSREFPW